MNHTSKVLYPNCENRRKLALSKYNFSRFFSDNKGKIKEATSKLQLTKKNTRQKDWSSQRPTRIDLTERKRRVRKNSITVSSMKNGSIFSRNERNTNIYLQHHSRT